MAAIYQDMRGPGVQKRPRTDGGEGDWICPSCGNNNFSFRNTCNIRRCGASKPGTGPEMVQRPMMTPLYDPLQPTQFIGASSSPVVASYAAPTYGAPPFMTQPQQYVGQLAPPPVAMSFVPSSPAFGVQQGYPSSAAYSSPTGFAPQGFLPTGGGYGGPGLDGSRMMMPGRGQPGPFVPDDASRKRRGGPDESGEGDWLCPNCGNNNFAFREVCNMRKCGTPRPGGKAVGIRVDSTARRQESESAAPDGSWSCKVCGNVNYPFRTRCNRRNCGAERTATGDGIGIPQIQGKETDGDSLKAVENDDVLRHEGVQGELIEKEEEEGEGAKMKETCTQSTLERDVQKGKEVIVEENEKVGKEESDDEEEEKLVTTEMGELGEEKEGDGEGGEDGVLEEILVPESMGERVGEKGKQVNFKAGEEEGVEVDKKEELATSERKEQEGTVDDEGGDGGAEEELCIPVSVGKGEEVDGEDDKVEDKEELATTEKEEGEEGKDQGGDEKVHNPTARGRRASGKGKQVDADEDKEEEEEKEGGGRRRSTRRRNKSG